MVARGRLSGSRLSLDPASAVTQPAGAEFDGSDLKALRKRLARKMRRLEALLSKHFPDLADLVKAALAVVAVGCLKDNSQPTTLVFVAPPSAGKSMALNFLMPGPERKDPLAGYFYRSDQFTAASFVSHRADANESKLKKIDLLPRLEGKTLITKELAPFFSGKREELMHRFSVLTSVLDGQGFVSDSGAQGRRGYARPINFQWLGATTPLSPEVLSVMAQLGPRILFYDADRPYRAIDELADLLRDSWASEDAKALCKAATVDVLLALFDRFPVGRTRSSKIRISEQHLSWLALWSVVLVRLRCSVRKRNRAFSAGDREHPERVSKMLRNVAIGSAIVHGRLTVKDYDLAQIAHIAVSSGVPMRGRVFRALLSLGGTGSTPQIEETAQVSTPTALQYMRELAAVGLAAFTEGHSNKPARAMLVEPYSALCEAPLLRKAKRGEGGGDSV
jgi:hypothetical protein